MFVLERGPKARASVRYVCVNPLSFWVQGVENEKCDMNNTRVSIVIKFWIKSQLYISRIRYYVTTRKKHYVEMRNFRKTFNGITRDLIQDMYNKIVYILLLGCDYMIRSL